MRTHTAFLHRGARQAIPDGIIHTARQRGYSRLLLETGKSAAFELAHASLSTQWLESNAAFGEYTATDFNAFTAKTFA